MSNSKSIKLVTPLFIAGLMGLTGCQTDPKAGLQETAFVASISRDVTSKEKSAGDATVWRETYRERREAYLKKLEQRREERRQAREERKLKPGKNDGLKKLGLSKKSAAKSDGKFGNLIARYALEHGVPFELARAVVQVESNFRPNATGSVGEVGLMQIRLATARGMGYRGSKKQLYDPATNLYWGMKYLGKAHQLSGGSTCGTILKYNAGHGAKRMNPVSSKYCGRVKRILS